MRCGRRRCAICDSAAPAAASHTTMATTLRIWGPRARPAQSASGKKGRRGLGACSSRNPRRACVLQAGCTVKRLEVRKDTTLPLRSFVTRPLVQAALATRLFEISRAKSVRETPSATSERIRRSRETDASPASIFATRDWLDLSSFATASWVSCLSVRRRRSPSARRNFSSMYSSSEGNVRRVRRGDDAWRGGDCQPKKNPRR